MSFSTWATCSFLRGSSPSASLRRCCALRSASGHISDLLQAQHPQLRIFQQTFRGIPGRAKCNRKKTWDPECGCYELWFQGTARFSFQCLRQIHPREITGFTQICQSKASRRTLLFENVQFSSVQWLSRIRLCDPTDCSTPGLPVHHQLPEFTQTHVHLVSDAIQPSHPLLSPSPPAFNLSQHQGLFKWVSSLHQVAKVLEFQLQHQSFQWTPRTDL